AGRGDWGIDGMLRCRGADDGRRSSVFRNGSDGGRRSICGISWHGAPSVASQAASAGFIRFFGADDGGGSRPKVFEGGKPAFGRGSTGVGGDGADSGSGGAYKVAVFGK